MRLNELRHDQPMVSYVEDFSPPQPPTRRCFCCNTILSRYNPQADCYACQQKEPLTPAYGTRTEGNKSGYVGVYKNGNKYAAQIERNRKRIHLGLFDTAEEASAVREVVLNREVK